MRAGDSIARLALAGGLVATLAFGGAALPGAFAADGTATQGDITINANTHVASDTTTLLGYQLFKADVADQTVGSTTSKAVSNIAWGSPQAQTAVEDAIKAIEPAYAGTTAQDAADWLSAHASGSGSATVVDADDAFGKIAAAMRTAGATATTVTPGTKATLDEGYWLFVTNTGTTSDLIDKVGTAPIYAVVGGSAVTVDQKSSLPTVNKYIKNDATGSDWAKAADSQVGQSIDYKLTGTVSTALASYGTYYYYSFSDALDSGLTADANSVKVMVQNPATGGTAQSETQVRADDYTAALDSTSNTLKVTINDLKSVKDMGGNAIAITPNSVVNVYYTAQLNTNAKVAGKSNDNTVTLTYSNNPGTDSHGDTTPATVRDYTYQLMLMKVDSSDNSKGLQNAKFTIQATGADEGASKKYVQKDGSLGDAAYEFTSGADGSIAVSGLDAGEYTVVETQAPTGYNTVPSFTFQIYPVYKDTTGDIDTIRVQTSNANVSAINVYDGVVDLVVKDKAGMTLPLTGQNGIALLWIVGGVMVAAGAVYLVRSRKKDKAQQ